MTEPACQIYLITPPKIDDIEAFAKTLDKTLAAAPIACLQIRLKGQYNKTAEDSVIIQAAELIVPICHTHGTMVIINDSPDLAKTCGADGVHLGQKDMDYLSSRQLLGEDAIIGVTCHNSKELAFAATKSGADYVAFGAIYETSTKDTKYRAELEILTWWNEAVEVPCVAIGGINPSNAADVIKAGADFIAISSGVWDHSDGPEAAAAQLYQLCLEHSA